MQETSEFFTVEEVAAMLKVHPETIRRWIRTKALPSYKLGAGFRIKKDDLDTFLEARWSGRGHAPSHIRERFCELVSQAVRESLSRAEWEELFRLTGSLWRCTDIVPDDVISDAGEICGEDIPQGSTYAQVCRVLRPWIREEKLKKQKEGR